MLCNIAAPTAALLLNIKVLALSEHTQPYTHHVAEI